MLTDALRPPPAVGTPLAVGQVLRALAIAHDALDNATPASIAAAQDLIDALEWRILTDSIATKEDAPCN